MSGSEERANVVRPKSKLTQLAFKAIIFSHTLKISRFGIQGASGYSKDNGEFNDSNVRMRLFLYFCSLSSISFGVIEAVKPRHVYP